MLLRVKWRYRASGQDPVGCPTRLASVIGAWFCWNDPSSASVSEREHSHGICKYVRALIVLGDFSGLPAQIREIRTRLSAMSGRSAETPQTPRGGVGL